MIQKKICEVLDILWKKKYLKFQILLKILYDEELIFKLKKLQVIP
jgi:hypothetical protein